MKIKQPKLGEAVWIIINGEPQKRYYVAKKGSGHILSFDSNLEQKNYHKFEEFYAYESDIWRALAQSASHQIQFHNNELQKRLENLQHAILRERAYGF